MRKLKNRRNRFSEFLPDKFKRLSPEKQTDFMRDWFLERYEDPVQHTPYDSGEGGYIWIYGGPYDPEEILEAEFGKFAKDGCIPELVEELHEISWEWTRNQIFDAELYPPDQDYDLITDRLAEDYELLDRLNKNLDAISKLSIRNAKLKDFEKTLSEMMAFGFCISLLETFLSEVFSRAVLKREDFKVNFMKHEKNLAQRKINLSEIFESTRGIDETIKDALVKILFHNLPLAKSLFNSVLGIDIGDIAALSTHVEKRHDFVHRGGRNRDGATVATSKTEILSLVAHIRSTATEINGEMQKKNMLDAVPF